MTKAQRRLLVTAILVAIGAPQLEAQAPTSRPATTGWRVKFDGSGSSPVIADGVLYVGSADGAVYAVNPATGDIKWRFQTGERLSPATSWTQVIIAPPGSTALETAVNLGDTLRREGRRRVDMAPAVANGTVFIGSGDRSFYAIDASTGKMRWSYEAGGGMAANNNLTAPWPAAVVKNGSAYFVTDEGLHAVDTLTGKRQWVFETLQGLSAKGVGKRVPSGPVLGDGVLFLTAWPFGDPRSKPRKSFLYAVDASSGKARWVTSVDGGFVTEPVTANGFVFFAVEDSTSGPSSDSATLYAIDAADGQVKWKFGAAQEFARLDLLVAGNTIYFRTDKSLSALELESGRQLWTFSSDEISHGLRADERHLYVVTHKTPRMMRWGRPGDTLHALDLSTGQERWSRFVGDSFDIAMISEGVVYGGGETLYALDAAAGKQLWSTKGLGSAHLIDGGKVFSISATSTYFGTDKVDQGYLSAIDAKTGKLARPK
ncbi:MAG TPA: PQQ-binding-like beta-propeller repeat protein [Vicinamibacterales bacterium]|nr:PQQ-binding-like beta-propeller repeat protein [Vicinamibacterales bacterium]